jgi:outer membrane protein assembly factor BamB
MRRFLTLVWLILPQAASAAGEWPQFRGPDGQGHAEQRGLPTEWSETKNIAFKSAVPGRGWSSPVIADGRIWLTTALDEGHSLHAVCLDESNGQVLHDIEVFQVAEPGTIHKKNSYASPTPILDADRVYVHFGDLGTACLASDMATARPARPYCTAIS